jgi:type III secretion protein L
VSAVVKASLTERTVRPLVLSGASMRQEEAKRHPPTPNPVELRLAAAGEEIAFLKTTLQNMEAAAAEQAAAAREEGRREGLASAANDEEGRVGAIAQAALSAAADVADRLQSLERLALLVAKAALAKVIVPTENQQALVAATINRAMATLEREAVLAIRVSACDFPDEEALAHFSARASIGTTLVRCDPEFGSGECRMDLKLGHLDLTLERQWRELTDWFDRLADEDVQP